MKRILAGCFAILISFFAANQSFADNLSNISANNINPTPFPTGTSNNLIQPRIVNPKGRADEIGATGGKHMVAVVHSEVSVRERPDFLESDLNIFQNQFCAGTMITNTWIVTAAQCVDNN
jgi:secreted trypsin-like serine protease